jgi:hypothetical protein
MMARLLAWMGIVIDTVDLRDVVRDRAKAAARAGAERLAWSLLAVPGVSRASWAMSRPQGEQ